MSPRCIKNKQN
jgi:salicylate hydroxylase